MQKINDDVTVDWPWPGSLPDYGAYFDLEVQGGEPFVSITSVQVDNELTKAKVFLSSLDEEEQLVQKVSRYKGKFRKAIGDQARIRRVPELEFILDPSISASTRIDEILAAIHATEKSNNQGANDN